MARNNTDSTAVDSCHSLFRKRSEDKINSPVAGDEGDNNNITVAQSPLKVGIAHIEDEGVEPFRTPAS